MGTAPTGVDPRPVTAAALRPRRRRWRWAVPAGLVVAGAAVLATAWWRTPLAVTGPIVADGTQISRLAEFGSRGSLVLRYDDGAAVSYAFRLRNDGILPVTVTGIELAAAEDRPLLVPTGLATADPPGLGGAATDSLEALATAPFQAFTLAPGASRTVVVTARLDNCEYYTERAIHLVDHHTVSARVAGVPATREVSLGEDLLVRSPTIQRCPERKMDRSARQR